MSYQVKRSTLKGLTLSLSLLLVAGCASSPPQSKHDFVPPVYPPPPDTARFIYERTLLYSDDIEEYTRAQRFKQFATGASRKLRGMVKPFDVAAHHGRVYVSDTVQRSVLLYDIPGKRLVEIGTDKPGELSKPLGIDVSVNDELFVTDATAQRIMVYNLDGVFQRAFGGKQYLTKPSDVTISPDGQRAYVIDTGGVENNDHRVQVFDASTGEHLQTIGKRGGADGEFNLPLQAAVGKDGTLYVVDAGNFRIQAFDSRGKFLSSFGSVGRYPGQFARPKGIAVDQDDNLYIIDTAFGNFQIFNRQGQLLMFIGERGQAGMPGKYMLPAGIDVDQDGRIYVVDQFFRKIDIYKPINLQTSLFDSPAGLGKP